MPISNENQPLDLKSVLVDLAYYRKEERTAGNVQDPLIILTAYAQDELVYVEGKIVAFTPEAYAEVKRSRSNDLVNKFGPVYAVEFPIFLHRKLADVLVDSAIDLRDRHGYFTVVMDGLRTYDCAQKLQENRPDLVTLGLLARAGKSAHNRALAVDSKLFHFVDGTLVEADEHGHLDDFDMKANSRFYDGDMSNAARYNRLVRLQAWQRASIKHQLPIANLLSEFWDDRVTGSPEDFWRVLACRALCISLNGNPNTNPIVHSLKAELEGVHQRHVNQHTTRQDFAETAYRLFVATWNQLFTKQCKLQLSSVLGSGAGDPPALSDFIFHEWHHSIYDRDLVSASLPKQLRSDSDALTDSKASTDIVVNYENPLKALFLEAVNARTDKQKASQG